VTLFAREFDPAQDTGTTVLLVHGVGSDGQALEPAAERLRDGSGARVVVLDQRGHGRSGGPRWSVAYAGQYDDDLADTLAALRREQPDGRLVLAAHSMGGGIALRHALKPSQPVDGYLLAAPLLGPTAPTARQGGSGAGAGGKFALFHTPRLFGVLMFDLVGVHAFDRLPILELNIPGRPAYGFAALQSMQPNAPNDYRAALKAIHQPLLLVAGSRDEAFNAAAYPGVIAAYSRGQALIVPGATHNSVLTDPVADRRMSQWLQQLPRPTAVATAHDQP
jgi:alpha-beta hydrolase superfamily lysophospholipase